MNRDLKCYVWGRRQVWEAICVDLDIAVSGDSAAEVEDALKVAVEGYLEAVAEMPPQDRQQLLHRRAPWHVRAKLAAQACLPGRVSGVVRHAGFRVRAGQFTAA